MLLLYTFENANKEMQRNFLIKSITANAATIMLLHTTLLLGEKMPPKTVTHPCIATYLSAIYTTEQSEDYEPAAAAKESMSSHNSLGYCLIIGSFGYQAVCVFVACYHFSQ